MKIMVFHEIGDFHDRTRLWHSCKVEQSAEKNIFHKKIFFSWETKTLHTSFLAYCRVWEPFKTTQNLNFRGFQLRVKKSTLKSII